MACLPSGQPGRHLPPRDSTTRFGKLLGELTTEHERLVEQLAAVQQENKRLRGGGSTSQGSDFNSCMPSLLLLASPGLPSRPKAKHVGFGPVSMVSASEVVCTMDSEVAGTRSKGTEGTRSLDVPWTQSLDLRDVQLEEDEIEGPRPRVPTELESWIEGMTAKDFAVPADLPDIYPEWKLNADDREEKVRATQNTLNKNTQRLQWVEELDRSGSLKVSGSSFWRRCVFHPAHPFRLLWDLCSMCFVAYDVIFIPVDIGGFNLEASKNTFRILDTTTAIFWALDIVMSFITGYSTEGVMEMRPRFIANHYVRTWFFFDFFVVVADWIFLLFGANAVLRMGKTNRITRIVRAVRLVRSIKLHRKLTQVLETVESEGRRAMLNVALLAGCVLMFNHYFACGWYFIAKIHDGPNNWIQEKVPEDTSEPYRYATALHWSLTQFTPAAMEISPSPANFSERMYSIVTLFFAMVTFSTFTASITTNMTALRRIQSEQTQQKKLLTDYFKEQRVSAKLGHTIWSYLKKHHFAYKKRLGRKDISSLKLLPPNYISKLNEELYVPNVKQCPFFFQYGRISYDALRHICDTAVSEGALSVADEMFSQGKPCDHLYIVLAGRLHYDHCVESLSGNIGPDEWACEPALWMKWVNYGNLSATTACQFLQINVGQFRSVVHHHNKSMSYVKLYVKQFRKYMLSLDSSLCGVSLWRTDLWTNTKHVVEIAQIARNAIRNSFCPDANHDANQDTEEDRIHRDSEGVRYLPSCDALAT